MFREKYGISGQVLEWISLWLTKMNGVKVGWQMSRQGVPIYNATDLLIHFLQAILLKAIC